MGEGKGRGVLNGPLARESAKGQTVYGRGMAMTIVKDVQENEQTAATGQANEVPV